MADLNLPEPTADQCDTHATITAAGRRAVATWHYPKMGGYVSKCWVVPDGDHDPDPDGCCFDVHVWHDGDFPFTGEDDFHGHRDPVVLHHCDADDFARFAGFAGRVVRGEDVSKPPPRRLSLRPDAGIEGRGV